MSVAVDAPKVKKPGPGLALSIAVMVVATVIGITGFAIGVTSAVHKVTHFGNGPRGFPGQPVVVELTPATWQIYVEDDDEGFFNSNIDASDVTVTGSDGSQIPVSDMPGNLTETESTGTHSYDAVARFDITNTGSYTITVASTPESANTEYLIGKSLGSQFSGLVKWFAMAGLGMLLGIAGLAMLIVGIVRRRNARRAFAYAGLGAPMPGTGGGYYPVGPVTTGPGPGPVAPPTAAVDLNKPSPTAPSAQPGLPPPNWYDDPHLPGMQRYWDGTRWTDQTRTTS